MRKYWLTLIYMGYAMNMAVAATNTGTNTSGLNDITNVVSTTICPIVKLFVGTGSWVVIGAVLIYGVVMLAWGGRNAFRTMGFAATAALLMAIVKSWVTSQAAAANQSVITACLG